MELLFGLLKYSVPILSTMATALMRNIWPHVTPRNVFVPPLFWYVPCPHTACNLLIGA